MLTQNPRPATTWIHIPGSKTWRYIAIAATLSATAAPAIADDSAAAIPAPEAAASAASAPSQPAVTPPASHWGAAMDDFLLTALALKPAAGNTPEIIPPPVDRRLAEGDRLVLAGKRHDLDRFGRA